MVMDGILLSELTGKLGDYFSVFGGSICNVNDLQVKAESSKNIPLLCSIYCYSSFASFWSGDYLSAEKYSHNALAIVPVSRMPSVLRIYSTFFGGLVAFQLFRKAGVGGARHLREGTEMMERMEKWVNVSKDVFENKWLLLKGEYSRSMKNDAAAEDFYQASIAAARDHGNIHELALAYELLGDHYAAWRYRPRSIEYYKNAYEYYKQWGATAVAERLSRKHNLNVDSAAACGRDLQIGNLKRSR